MLSTIVLYVPGERICADAILEIIDLPPSQWGPIEEAYPEIKAAGPDASFRRGQRNVVVHPPSFVHQKALKTLATVGDKTHHAYVFEEDGKPTSVLIHAEGGASVHIYRLRP